MVNRLVILALLVSVVVGCRHGAFTVREQELCCPTDVRQKHCWCWGEDAIMDRPCGVDEAYHGHKPTCWREWDAPAAVWRDEFCGASQCRATVVHDSVTVMSPTPAQELVTDQDAPTVAPPAQAPTAEPVTPPADDDFAPAPDDPPAETLELPELPPARRTERQPTSQVRPMALPLTAPAQPPAKPQTVAALPSDAELVDGPLPDAPALAMPIAEPMPKPAPKEDFELRIIQEAGYTPPPKRTTRTPYGFDFVK